MQFAAVLQYGRLFDCGEEAQCGNRVVLAQAIEQIERHHDARERSQNGEKLGQGQIQEEHGGYSSPPDRANGPKTASSIVVSVEMPT